MSTGGKCALCAGRLVREKDVVIAFGRSGAKLVLAWVCTECSAAWPIAIAAERFATTGDPLWESAERST